MPHFGFETTGTDIVDAFLSQVTGRTFLITGPSQDGIGAETAYCLARAKPELLILAGRTKSKIQAVVDAIEQLGINVHFLELDLSSQESIRTAVQALISNGTKIDVLINNAAIMACPFSLTTGGIEMQFGTNQLGPFLFTNLLLESGMIRERIVNVNSSAAIRRATYTIPCLDDLTYGNGSNYDPMRAYSVSKIANLLYTRVLATKVRSHGITTFSLNPGSIASPLQRFMSEELRDAAYAAARRENPDFQPPTRKTLQQGCATQLRAALDPSLVGDSGAFLDDCQVVESRVITDCYPFADKVWEICEQLTGQKFTF